MADGIVVCPQCRFEITLTEAISGPILERQRKVYEADARRRDEDMARREKAIVEKLAEAERAKAAVEQQVLARLRLERERIVEEEAKKARESSAINLRDLREQLLEKDKKLKEAQDVEVALRRERRSLEE